MKTRRELQLREWYSMSCRALACVYIVLAPIPVTSQGRPRAYKAASFGLSQLQKEVSEFRNLCTPDHVTRDWLKRVHGQGDPVGAAIAAANVPIPYIPRPDSMLNNELLAYRYALQGVGRGPGSIPASQRGPYIGCAVQTTYDFLRRRVDGQDYIGWLGIWDDILRVAAVFAQDGDQSLATRVHQFRERVGVVFGLKRIELTAACDLTEIAASRGDLKLATEHANRALDDLQALVHGDRAHLEDELLRNGGPEAVARERMQKRLSRDPDIGRHRVADAYARAASMFQSARRLRLPLQSRVHAMLEHASQLDYGGLDGHVMALAADAWGERQIAQTFAERVTAVEQAEAVERRRNEESYARRHGGKIRPEKAAYQAALRADAGRLRFIQQVVVTPVEIDATTWSSLATIADDIATDAALSTLSDDDNAGRAQAEQVIREHKQEELNRATKVIDAFKLGMEPDKLVRFYQVAKVSLPTDSSYLLDRISDPTLKLALRGLEVTELENLREAFEQGQRDQFFESDRAQRAYYGLLRELVKRGQPEDLDAAVAIGELARARQLKDLSGRGRAELGELTARPQTFVTHVKARLGPGRLLVSYHVYDDVLLMLVVDEERTQVREIPIGRDALTKRVAAVRSALTKKTKKDPTKAIDALSPAVLDPLLPHLRNKTEVLVLADGALNQLPLEILTSDRQRLIERVGVAYLPSIALLLDEPAQTPAARLFVLEDPVALSSLRKIFPSLPGMQQEVKAIARYFSTDSIRKLRGKDATKARLESLDLSGFRYLHFVAHGVASDASLAVLRKKDPSRQHNEPELILAAAPDPEQSFLRASDAAKLRLQAQLVVLSACETGFGSRVVAGEGMLMALSRAFLIAGAQQVVASLWNVDDTATQTLMTKFYGYLTQGMSVTGALRQAKLDWLAHGPAALSRRTRKPQKQKYCDSNHTHPYCWSSFVVFGRPDSTHQQSSSRAPSSGRRTAASKLE